MALVGLDLFSGIGGLTRALGGYVLPSAYCEIDPYCRAVLLSRMWTGDLPVAPVWDDVRTLRRAELHDDFDIIYGGFPCQDISVAGRGAGLAGERSGLFFQITRLARELRPRFVFLENVPAIRTRGGNVVGEELARLGFDCRWAVVSAAEVGAPHLRKRWFLLAHAARDGREQRRAGTDEPRETGRVAGGGEPVADSTSEQGRGLQSGGFPPDARTGGSAGSDSDPTRLEGRFGEVVPECSGERVAGARGTQAPNAPRELWARPGREGNWWPESSNRDWWKVEPPVGRVVDELPRRVDRLRALGNAVVPLQAREAFERLLFGKSA